MITLACGKPKRTMRHHALLPFALCVVAVGCVGARRARRHGPTVIPVTASSIQTVYGIQGRFEGTVAVRGDWIYVVVLSEVRTYQRPPAELGPRIRAALATCRRWPMAIA